MKYKHFAGFSRKEAIFYCALFILFLGWNYILNVFWLPKFSLIFPYSWVLIPISYLLIIILLCLCVLRRVSISSDGSILIPGRFFGIQLFVRKLLKFSENSFVIDSESGASAWTHISNVKVVRPITEQDKKILGLFAAERRFSYSFDINTIIEFKKPLNRSGINIGGKKELTFVATLLSNRDDLIKTIKNFEKNNN